MGVVPVVPDGVGGSCIVTSEVDAKLVKRNIRMRADPSFRQLKKSLEVEDVSDTDFTRGVAEFLVKEDLLPLMKRRVQKKKRGGLFG